MYKDDCVFCQIVQGKAPAKRYSVTGGWMAFDSIARFAPVHILICPLEHLTDFMRVNFNALFLIAETLAKELEIYHTGFRIVCNRGRDAHQTIEHLHIHLFGGRDLGVNFAGKEA